MQHHSQHYSACKHVYMRLKLLLQLRCVCVCAGGCVCVWLCVCVCVHVIKLPICLFLHAHQVVLGCMDSMLRSPIVQPNDHVKVHTCNGAVNLRLSCFASKYDHARLETSITERPGNPSSTRLWDGINVTYKDMLKHDEIAQNGRTVLRYMLVFTDGGDNASRMDVDEVGRRKHHHQHMPVGSHNFCCMPNSGETSTHT